MGKNKLLSNQNAVIPGDPGQCAPVHLKTVCQIVNNSTTLSQYFHTMKNCLEFTVFKLTEFIVYFGVFEILDALNQFQVITDIITLDRHYLRTTDLEEMRFGATKSQYGYLNLKAQSDIVNYLVKLITNPRSPKEALQINTALKSLSKKHGKSGRFYDMLHEGLHRRMLFTKLNQIFTPLMEEIKTNQELLIMLLNNKLIEMDKLQEISGHDQTPLWTAHYIIDSINTYQKLKKFNYIIENWARDSYMIEELQEIVYEIELWQCQKINEKITEDLQKTICELY